MMDDIQEQTELADEISRAISEPAGFGMDVDEVSKTFAQLMFRNKINLQAGSCVSRIVLFLIKDKEH